MTLDHDIAEALRRQEITREAALAEQSQRTGESVPAQARNPCTDPHATTRYVAAAAWIEQSGNIAAQRVLAMHREAIEPRRPVGEGGNGTLRPCLVFRRRADVVRFAVQLGWRWEGEPGPAVPPGPDRHRRKPCPAAEAIRASAPRCKDAYLVGKGPSLDRLTPADFPETAAPILCCNEAVHAVEKLELPNPIFGVQQDARLRLAARPTHATWLLSKQAWKSCKGPDYPGAIMYDSEAIGGSTKSLTANQCLRMLGLAGVSRAVMLAFDACTCGQTDYARSVGVASNQFGQKPERFRGYCPEIARAARNEGIALTWQPPPEGWTVVCVMRSGGRYGREHVEWLRKQVAARIVTPHVFACLTDQPQGADYAIRLQTDWPGWWAKIALGRPGQFAGGVLYLDLDVVLTRDIRLPHWDQLTRGELYARQDWGRAGQINSSVMMWRGDALAPAFARFNAEPGKYIQEFRVHGDQAYTSMAMAGHIQPMPLAVNSYKLSSGAKPTDTDIMVFHGDPKPWALKLPWIPPFVAGKFRWDFLSHLAREIGARTFVEVGTKEGKTSQALLLANPDLRVYNVDLFQPQPAIGDGENYTGWNWPAILADCQKRLAPYRDRCITIIGDQCAAAAMVPAPVCLVFLDADHRTEPTRAAIRAWLPRIRPGGILAGHDYDWDTVRAAVREELGERAEVLSGPDAVWYVRVGDADASSHAD